MTAFAQGFSADLASLEPQGIDFASIARGVASTIAPTLPVLIASLLSTHPQMQQLASHAALHQMLPQQSQPQFAANGAVLAPQGIDFAGIAREVAKTVLPALPGLIGSLLSAQPHLVQAAARSAVAPQSFSPQGFDFAGIAREVAKTVLPALPGLISGLLSAQPHLVQAAARSAVAPQGFDFAGIAREVAKTVAPTLPSLIASLLSTQPHLAQPADQGSVAPQSFGFSFGLGLGL